MYCLCVKEIITSHGAPSIRISYRKYPDYDSAVRALDALLSVMPQSACIVMPIEEFEKIRKSTYTERGLRDIEFEEVPV